ncbi:hypothetical protein [Liquorilactobacillus mali]|uniref:hypothetical protein n=1 Tax=Liquorilactobacillus mali TaxID=1618 RepID=UPI00235022D5|nr:hypothetical protein [Liquorilactobacillus mali]MDC7953201.1 hypothetical protein [Liquorilactobacillus mali]
MERKNEIDFIQNKPEDFIKVSGRTLEDRLEDVQLPLKQEKKILNTSSKEAIKDVGKKIVSKIPIASAISDAAFIFMDWNKKIDEDFEDTKKKMLIEEYLNKADSQEKAIQDLKETITNVYGNTLVNKIFRILSDYPPDGDLLVHLKSALNKICESKHFEELFTKHKFNLSLIEKLSPQALTILSDVNNWPDFSMNTRVSFGGKINENFKEPFVEAYLKEKQINDENKKARFVYIINELSQEGFIECHELKNGQCRIFLTVSGKELFEYLN